MPQVTRFRIGRQSKATGIRRYGAYLNPTFVDIHQWATDYRQEWEYFEVCWVSVENGWPKEGQ